MKEIIVNDLKIKDVLWFAPGIKCNYDEDFFEEIDLLKDLQDIISDVDLRKKIINIFSKHITKSYTSRTIGIILGETLYKERKAYIGIVPGKDSDADIEHIAKWGGKFHAHTADIIKNFLTEEV